VQAREGLGIDGSLAVAFAAVGVMAAMLASLGLLPGASGVVERRDAGLAPR
jgi:hypothetical protein